MQYMLPLQHILGALQDHSFETRLDRRLSDSFETDLDLHGPQLSCARSLREHHVREIRVDL